MTPPHIMNGWAQQVGPWPDSISALEDVQRRLGAMAPPPWIPADSQDPPCVAGCFVCFSRVAGSAAPASAQEGPGAAASEGEARRSGRPGDPGWAAAALIQGRRVLAVASFCGQARCAYDPGHLALREGPLLESAITALPRRPDVLLVNATGLDHPRRAGLALHLGARLDVPTVGVTNRLLLSEGDWPEDRAGATCPFRLQAQAVGTWLRVRQGVRPLAVHAGWRTDVETALAVVRSCLRRARTPEPLRRARRAAREARSRSC